MLSAAKVVPSLAVTDVARARHFYEDKLGLEPLKEGTGADHVMYRCGGDTRLYIFHREAVKPEATVAVFQVADIESEVADLKSRGVRFEEIEKFGLKMVNSILTTGPVKSAWFKDTEGNLLSLVQAG